MVSKWLEWYALRYVPYNKEFWLFNFKAYPKKISLLLKKEKVTILKKANTWIIENYSLRVTI